MKNKNKILAIIFIVIVVVIGSCVIAFSPNMLANLLGNINSIDNEANEEVKTGVILDANLGVFIDIKEDGSFDPFDIPLKLYNGSNKEITINKIVTRKSCYGITDCTYETKDFKTLDTPIIVQSDSDYTYDLHIDSTDGFEVADSGFFDLGVQYVLDNKVYNIMTPMLSIPNTSSFLKINDISASSYVAGTTFQFNNGILPEISQVNMTVSTFKNDGGLKMDISEDLAEIGVYYSIGLNAESSWQFYHPQSKEALTNSMLGEQNKSNISEYFDFSYVETNESGSGNLSTGDSLTIVDGKVVPADKDDALVFSLVGKPKRTFENVTIIPGFYFRQYSEDGSFDYPSDKEGIYTINDVPNLTITVYDKTKLKEAIENAFEKMKDLSDENCNKESFINFAYNVIQNAQEVYVKRNVTQAQIDEAVNTINGLKVEMNPVANYAELDSTIAKIQSLNRDYYSKESMDEIDALLQRYEEGLSSNYQIKIDNLNTKLTELYNNLEMLDADYSKVDEAIKKAETYVNETSEGKELYTKESWNRLQSALNSVVRGKKINEQQLVDKYAQNILSAIESLEIAPADYEQLLKIINEYKSSYGYINDWYTEETKTVVDNYINGITYDKDVTEQQIVDNWYNGLLELLNKLELKRALGYYDSDNYDKLESLGVMSLESYVKYFNSLEKQYYTEESIEVIDQILAELNNPDSEVYKYTIAEQEEFDITLYYLQVMIDTGIQKKPGNYEELCYYYEQALNINTNYYEDLNDLMIAISNVDFDLKLDEQDKIDAQTKALKDAINNLVLKDADYTEFNKAYDKAISLSPSHYVDFSSLRLAIEDAKRVMGLKIDEQNLVDEATKKLNEAMDKLILKDADYSQIDSLKAIIEQLDSSKYTNYNVVEKALKDIVYGKKANEQSLVDEMYNNLRAAYDSLIKIKADYSKLYEVLEKAKEYEKDKDNYSNYLQLEKIINGINYDLTWDQQSVVDGYVTQINNAISNLRKKLADYSKLEELISKIPNDYSNLDKELQAEIEELLKEAKALPSNLTFEEQYRIDNLVNKFETVINKIPSKDDSDDSKEVILSCLKVNGSDVNINLSPFTYNVGYDVSSADIEVGVASKSSTVKIYGGKVLVPGENNITIIITTSQGKTYTYRLIINRSTTSDYLSDLKVAQGEIDFNKTKQEYNIKVDKNTDKLDLSAITEDENAKVTIKGNKNIKNGSKVYIEVESADGNVRVYTLNVQKKGSVDIKVIIILVMVLAVLSGIFKFIQERYKYKKQNNA